MTATVQDYGQWFRGDTFNFAEGGTESVKLNFLNAARGMVAPEVVELMLEVAGSATPSTTVFGTVEQYQLIDRIRMEDMGGIFYDLKGTSIRQVEFLEMGGKRTPNETIIVGPITPFRFFAHLTYDPQKAIEGRDFAIPLQHFLAAGQVAVTMGAPAPGNVLTGVTFRLWARVKDAGTTQLKSRMTWREYVITKQEDWYNVNGLCRAAFITSQPALGVDYTNLNNFVNFDSRDLGWPPAMSRLALNEWSRGTNYTEARLNDGTLTDPFVDQAFQSAIPLVMPQPEQRTARLQDLATFDLDLNQAPPVNGRMVICAIQTRNPDLAALVAGFGSVADYVVAVKARGMVKTPFGMRPASTLDPRLVSKLPLTVSAEV